MGTTMRAELDHLIRLAEALRDGKVSPNLVRACAVKIKDSAERVYGCAERAAESA